MTLEERAAEQFAAHPDLRILFFFDPDEAHRDAAEAWSDETIACVVADRALFGLKLRLEHALQDTPVVLYVPAPRPADWSAYPLADLLAANRELRIDDVAEFLERYELDPRRHRALVERYYRGELEYKNRQQFLATILTDARLTERTLRRGLAAYHLDARFRTVPREEQLLAGVLLQATDAEGFEDYRERCKALDLADMLGRLLADLFELGGTSFTYEQVLTAAQKLKYNLLLRHVAEVHPDDPYDKLRLASPLNRNRLVALADAWRESTALDRPPEVVLGVLAPDVDEEQLLEVYGPETRFGYLTPVLRRRRLQQAARLLRTEPSAARERLAELQGSDAAAALAADLIGHMAAFYQVLRGYATLDLGPAGRFVETYADELYRCDAAYRHAALAHRRLRREAPALAELLREAHAQFLVDYRDAFVHPLNTAWQQALQAQATADAPTGDASPAWERQGAFYDRYVASDDQKTAVIVSDALRYEAARELSDRLVQADARKQAALAPLVAALPTVTAVGMAHLLPHRTLTLRAHGSRVDVEVDGRSSAGTRPRARILEAAQADAHAVAAGELQDLSSDEGRALFKQHPLVYVYHDRIDATGDSPKTEGDTPAAVADAIDELEQLIRSLNNWNVYRVVVTADHGFLYMDGDVPASMQEPFPTATGVVLRRNRCLVAARCEADGGYRFPLQAVSDLGGDLEVCVPRAVNRYRLSGAGKQFAHGGASLQEMIIPALEVRKGREERAEKVSLRLLSKERTIRSGALRVELLQKEAVSSSYQARTVTVALYDDETPVSDEKTLTFDATASDPTERTETLILTLGPDANRLNFCTLQVYDVDDHNRLNPVVSQRYSIQRLIEQDDF